MRIEKDHAGEGRAVRIVTAMRRVSAIAILATSFVCSPLIAQVRDVRGRVLDAMHETIPNAKVTATRGEVTIQTVQTDVLGSYQLQLAPGQYVIAIEKEGFLPSSVNTTVDNSVVILADVELQVETVSSTVTVSESAGYLTAATASATKTLTPLRDVPQSITVVPKEQIKDQMMMSIADVVRYVPGITAHQGENNRDQLVIRGNSTSADFFVNGVRDDVQYYRDLYNVERVEALKGPNAMIFGRGGAGGVVNRVTKQPEFMPVREVTLQGGSFGNKRFATDFDQPLGDKAAFRMNAVYENSDSFRRYVNLERYGVSPSLLVNLSKATRLTLNYEHFRDFRTADRGIPSFRGLPVDAPISTFFGNPDDSHVRALVHLGSAAIEHQAGGLNIRNRTQVGGYDRGYQNYVPGGLTADQSQLPISTYNNSTQRLNVFNQTDLTYTAWTGRIRHTMLWGGELGRQLTDNFRNTGYFNNSAATVMAPYANPVIATPVTFRQSATDADNHISTNLAAGYFQDQIELSRFLQVLAGIRVDRFDLQYRNNRTSELLGRIDNLISPRAGLVLKPTATLSVYSSYSVSYLPSAGDQFSSLTTITQQVKPEKFSNYEVGVKWDVMRSLSLTTAVFRLDRTNTRSTDPNDPTRIVQTGSQRTNGIEFGGNGNLTRKWRILGGYGFQDAFVTSATTAARAGAQVAQAPHHTFSLWNNYQLLRRLGAGLGVLNRSDMFAAIDNTVTLPSYTRADAAVFFTVTERVRLQANVENLFDRRYYTNADSNTNISPGFPRAVRVALTARF